MFASVIRRLALAAFGWGILVSAGPAQASQIINISAQTPVGPGGGTAVFIAAGQYQIQWIDGVYNGAYTNGCSPSCNWTETLRDADGIDFNPTGDGTVNFYAGGSYSSQAAALSAAQTGPIAHGAIQFTGGVAGAFQALSPISMPWIVNVTDGWYNFAIPDGDGRTDNNFGGVSIQLTPVPEPAAWALMIVGFGGAGAMLRRRSCPCSGASPSTLAGGGKSRTSLPSRSRFMTASHVSVG